MPTQPHTPPSPATPEASLNSPAPSGFPASRFPASRGRDRFEAAAWHARVPEWMAAGTAKPFKQPWYIPIPAEPANSGIPLGGISSTFTLTPAGTVPTVGFLPGWHVTPPDGKDFGLHRFHYAERLGDRPLRILDEGAFRRRLRQYPLIDSAGRLFFPETLSLEDAEAQLEKVVISPFFYGDQKERFARWHFAPSRATLAALQAAAAAKNAIEPLRFAQRRLLVEFFRGSVGQAPEFSACLQAAGSAPGADYPPEGMEVSSLYPVTRTRYAAPGQRLKLTQWSFSPLFRGDERACSLPVSVSVFELENPGNATVEATLVRTVPNLSGGLALKKRPGVQDAWFEWRDNPRNPRHETLSLPLKGGGACLGLKMEQDAPGADAEGAMAMGVCVREEPDAWLSLLPAYYNGQEASALREPLRTGGFGSPDPLHLLTGRETLAGALCVTLTLPPGSRRRIAFALVLDFPHIRFPGHTAQKKYTAFYPDAAARPSALVQEALENAEAWLEKALVQDYPQPAAGDSGREPALSEGFRRRLRPWAHAQIGFLAEASVWDTQDRFWMRECADYPFFNSLDVYFYGSSGLMRLLPRLNGCILREFADAILAEDPKLRRYWEYAHSPYADLPEARLEGPRAVKGAVPHDMGSPFDPKPDAYIWHNVKHWKDLAPKYALMVLRQWRLSGDTEFARACFPALVACMDYLSAMKKPGETLPFTEGTDDTFDNLITRGISVYCGSLWIAGLRAAAAVAEALGETQRAEEWEAESVGAEADFVRALWNEEEGVYRFWQDPVGGGHSDEVFADQLLADTWLQALGLRPITPLERRRRVLRKIIAANWKTHSPWLGAANLCGPRGETLGEFQAQDVWIGVQASLALAMLDAGMPEDAEALMALLEENVRVAAKIPYAAPEGLNGSAALTPAGLAEAAYLGETRAREWMDWLAAQGALDAEGRCRAASRRPFEEFRSAVDASQLGAEVEEVKRVHAALLAHGLQYTAARYLRPGLLLGLPLG